MAPRRHMSLEMALDEEAKEIRALLEEEKKSMPSPRAATRARTSSPAHGHRQSPSRNLLSELAPGVARSDLRDGRSSALNSPTGSTASEPAPIRSMLEYGSPPNSAGLPRQHRQSSGLASPGLPTIHQGLPSPKHNIEEAYQFDMQPGNDSHALPKRVSQGGKRKGAMSTVYGPPAQRPDRHSMSPDSFTGARSRSPSGRSRNGSNTLVSDSGKVIDLKNAHKKMSDAALRKSGGSLASLPTKKNLNVETGEELAPDGGVRLTKDYDEELEPDSSDAESGASSGEEIDAERRGRGRTRKGSQSSPTSAPRQPQSLLAAAEEESKAVYDHLKRKESIRGDALDEALARRHLHGKTVSTLNNNNVRTLLDVTNPKAGYIATPKKSGIHPRTSFDVGGRSGINTPVDSDEEQTRSDFNTAQRMALTLSPVHSSPEAHRCIRQILRGDFRKYQAEAEQGLRRQRMYLVATDLSEEAAYALEWTIGTVLRDGDTLLAVYAVDEEAGTGGDSAASGNSVGIGEGSSQMREAAAIVRTLSNQQGVVVRGESRGRGSTDAGRSLSRFRTGSQLRTTSHARAQSQLRTQSHARAQSVGTYADKAERERHHATEEITDRCVRLLRKTKLQVRVVVEVFHCKSPKHMITEVIDYLEPTLVILGSRGRSALKGVLLGSFSNYLVTKSSVPVMVARKKLRKHSKLKGANLRLSNMLQTPGSNRLESAVVDRPTMVTRRNSLT